RRSQMDALVEYRAIDRVAEIRLNRPGARNALNDALNAELGVAWERFAADGSADVAILMGAGPAFCAGVDLKSSIPRWLEAGAADLRANVRTGIAGGITRGGHRLAKPIIAAIHGHAVGG